MTPSQSLQTALQQIDSRPLTRHQKSLIALVISGNIAEFFDMFLIGFVVSLLTDPWQLSGLQAGSILACSGLGTVLGAIIWGRLADSIGRKRAFFWCVLMFSVFTLASVFTPERGWIMLAMLRILVGIGVGGLNIVSIPYVQEFVPAKHRGFLSGLASVFIPLGLFLGALAQWGFGDNWRGLIALGALPILLLFWLNTVPESPRFLLVRGRPDQARQSLAWALELSVDDVGALPSSSNETPSASYRTVVRHHWRSLLIVATGTFSFVLGSATIQSWGQTLLHEGYLLSTTTVAALFMFVSLADLLGRLGVAWLADKIGRRPTLLMCGVFGAGGSFLMAFSAALGAGGSWVMFFAGVVIAMAFGDGAFGILNAFGAEQFPNHVRATGLGLGYGIGASAKIFGPLVMGLLIGGSVVKQEVTLNAVVPAFILFAALLFAAGLIYMFAKETNGTSLDAL
ncbi:MFS transporter [Arcanobacterium pinnipediorum]|uniref:MFS transporter n=1 Tax=Arcanobacterium pinnipediorum TaxID=1503041 RepID=A0ABY5AGP2_9ACTO|nr:MFS transporter [Arcanobacterium pinnipediorum]USR79005.1 MFS transporter [Arcanobacterium pinnipediorum]